MILYHTSKCKYKVGKIIEADGTPTKYYQGLLDNGNGWIEDLFEEKKPSGIVSRKSCVFAFGNIIHCLKYNAIASIKEKGEIFYYEVEMNCAAGYPMVLTGHLYKKGKEYSKKFEIINEYWNPTKTWKYLEYIALKMEIKKFIPEPEFKFPYEYYYDYQDDEDLVGKIWP
jgi:hypothetical protein